MSDALRAHGLWHARFLCPPLSPDDVVQWLSHVRLFVIPWTAAEQASLTFTISWSLLKLMSIESVMNPTILFSVALFSCLQSFPTSVFSKESVFPSGGQSIGASTLALPVNIQGWFPLELTGLTSLQYKGFWRVFSSITMQKHQLFGSQPSLA